MLVERQRAYGRRLCEGAAAYACECQGISLGMLEWRDLENARYPSGYDAFIVRVLDDRTDRILRRTRRPVVDVLYGKRRVGFGVADLDNVAIGSLAAEHFISRGFREFAYCGYNGINFSDVRRQTFVCKVGSESASRRAGFTSVQYFCRAFMAAHKMSPTDWRFANSR